MKTIIILSFVISLIKGIPENERYLEAPQVISVSLQEPEGLYITWWPVRQRLDDPITGYKIRLWEIPESSGSEFQLINAETYPGLVQNDEPLVKFNISNTSPVTKEHIVDTGDGILKTSVQKIKYNTLYEVRVLAFKIDVEGPLSLPVRIKIIKGNGYQVVLQRTMTGCQMTVPSEVEHNQDPYPYLYNSFF